MARTSGPGETAGKEPDAGDHDPCLDASDCFLEVLGETAISPEPSERPLDHPSPFLWLERAHALGTRDNLDRPSPDIGDRVEQLGAAVDAISEQVPQPGKRTAGDPQQRHRPVIVLD